MSIDFYSKIEYTVIDKKQRRIFVFEYTDCDVLEYTSLTEDTEFEEKFTEREKPSESLKKLGIMQGDPDGNMHLNDKITRAEAVALLVRVHKRLDRKISNEFTGFSDMKGHWADAEITYAKNAGITDGTSQTTIKNTAKSYKADDNTVFVAPPV